MDIEFTEDKKQVVSDLMKKLGIPEICPECGEKLKLAKLNHDDLFLYCLTRICLNPFYCA